MKICNFTELLKEDSSYPESIDVSKISREMTKYARKIWINKINDLFLNKFVYFKGDKWSDKGHSWNYFFIQVKNITIPAGLGLFTDEFNFEDIDDEFYTVLSGEIIKIYNSKEDYITDTDTKKYNI